MKTLLCGALLLGVGAGAPLAAEILAADDFDSYPAGNVGGQNGGTGWGAAWESLIPDSASAGADWVVQAGGLGATVPNGGAIAGGANAVKTDHNSSLRRPFAGGVNVARTFYVRFLVQFTSSNNNFSEDVFFHLVTESGFNSFFAIKSTVPGQAGPLATGGSVEGRLANKSFTSKAVSFPLNTPVVFVGKVTHDGAGYSRLDLFVNPRYFNPRPDYSFTLAAGEEVSPSVFTGVRLQHGRGALIDGLVIGTTLEDVLPAGSGGFAPFADAGPDATIPADNVNFESDAAVALDGSFSAYPGSTLTDYVWRLGNRIVATGATPTVRLPVGVHDLDLTVTGGDGLTATDRVRVTVTSSVTFTYQLWAGAAFGGTAPGDEATVWGRTADPDKDGVPNALEYLLDTDPLKGVRTADFSQDGNPRRILVDADGDDLVVNYIVSKIITGVTPVLEWSAGLPGGWRTDGVEERIVADLGYVWRVEARIKPQGAVKPRLVRLGATPN